MELTGRITRGSLLIDNAPCFVLIYGCQFGRRLLPTMPPVPNTANLL